MEHGVTKRVLLGLSLLLLIGWAGWSYYAGGVIYLLLGPEADAAGKLARVQEYFRSWGPAAPAVYTLIVIVEVILAPIPGTLLYLPGGVIFGGFVGGLTALTGNVLGAGISCQISRTLGGSYVGPYLERGALKKYEAILEKHGLWIVFLLRVNPLTSSDLVSYAAGLTHMPVWKVMTGTLLGMAPLCFAQAYFAQEILIKFPRLIYPLILLGVVYAIYVIKTIRQLAKQGAANRAAALAVEEGREG